MDFFDYIDNEDEPEDSTDYEAMLELREEQRDIRFDGIKNNIEFGGIDK